MLRNLLLTGSFIMASSGLMAQTSVSKPSIETKLYSPTENAEQAIAAVVKKAHNEKKNVLIMAGGNWCSWCLEFNRFTTSDPTIDSLIKSDFEVYHLNYSKENINKETFAKYSFPQRFGFPVFIVLDENGNYIHTQNSGYLEEGKSYNKEKVLDFLQSWNKKALDPASYINQ